MRRQLLFCALALGANHLSASIISTSGTVSVVAPPASAQVNTTFESDTQSLTFVERTGFVLPSAVAVDFTNPGTYTANPAVLGTIPAGLAVDSYFVSNDPVGSSAANLRSYAGSLTFNANILGVIVLDPEFASSNGILGHPGTLYSPSNISFELSSTEFITISADRRTLTFADQADTAADDIRIVTAAAVPEPSLVLLTISGLLLTAAGLRRRKASQ